jgi:8-oxo-dGTP pyrophosphatase MutT (NUDIX family)
MKSISAGGVIINKGRAAIVTQKGKSFSFPKGHIEGKEKPLETAYREIYEETGLKEEELKFIEELEVYTRPDGVTGNPKEIHLFLFSTTKEELNPIDEDNPEAEWVDVSKVCERLSYKEDKEFFERHMERYRMIK